MCQALQHDHWIAKVLGISDYPAFETQRTQGDDMNANNCKGKMKFDSLISLLKALQIIKH